MFKNKFIPIATLVSLAFLFAGCHGAADQVTDTNPNTTTFTSNQYFANTVIEYKPAPGQWVNNSSFNNTLHALGIPDKKVVSLGGFGGSITVKLITPITDRPGQPDFVVWGNAFYDSGDIRRRWAEPATIEISEDGVVWYLIGGSIFSPGFQPLTNIKSITFNKTNALYWPAWATLSNQLDLKGYDIGHKFFQNVSSDWYVNSGAGSSESLYGFADCTDDVDNRNGDFVNNNWSADDPFTLGSQNSCGDAIMLEWAVDSNGNSIYTTISNKAFYYVRCRTAVNYIAGVFLEFSPEIDAIGVIP